MSAVVIDWWGSTWLGVVLVLSVLNIVIWRGDSGESASYRTVVRLGWWWSNIASRARAVLSIALLKGALAWILTWPVPS